MLTFKNLIHHFVLPLPQRGRLNEPPSGREVLSKAKRRENALVCLSIGGFFVH